MLLGYVLILLTGATKSEMVEWPPTHFHSLIRLDLCGSLSPTLVPLLLVGTGSPWDGQYLLRNLVFRELFGDRQ